MAVEITLFSPDITCEHCIATIKATTDAIEGAKSFIERRPPRFERIGSDKN